MSARSFDWAIDCQMWVRVDIIPHEEIAPQDTIYLLTTCKEGSLL